MPTLTKNKAFEQPIKKIIPQIDIKQQKQQQEQQQQQQQNEQENETDVLEKGLKATKKELLIPLSKNQKKIMRC